MAIISSGIGSGLDINSIVTQLVEVQKGPQVQRLDVREARLQARLSGYGTLQSALASLQQSLNPLRLHGTFSAQAVSVGDAAVLRATASSGAVAGSHQVSVEGLATAHRLVTDPGLGGFASDTAVLGTGTLTFSFGATVLDEETGEHLSFTANPDRPDRTVTITDGSLRGVRDAINQAGMGVQAAIVFDGEGYRLSLTSSDTGAMNGMRITVADDDGDSADATGLSMLAFNGGASHLQQTQAARDTSGLVIDGIPITSASNTVRGAIDGVEITLQGAGSSSLALAPEDGGIVDAIAGFVERFNTLVATINRLSSFDPETGTAGLLNGDGVLRSAETQVRRVLSAMTGGDAAFRHLSEIGISHNVEDGSLILDREHLQRAIAQDREGVANLFAGVPAEDGGVPTGGYAAGLDQVLTGLLGRGGIFSSAVDGVNSGIRDLAREREQVELRSLAFEERTRAQFTAMDALIAQLRSTSDFLMQQLDNLPAIGQRANR